MAREVPIRVWRRTNDPGVVWRFRTGGAVPPLADSYALVVDLPGVPAAITHATGAPALAIDRIAGTVTWAYTLDESAMLPLGDSARYELMGTSAGATRCWAGGGA